ncbi:Hypothetical_protein [Hexamita inflata]|uniref:Hypothetical_protein n=1 Tax=Hexamita inflata TaxID=28002 RepID=A0AA86PIT5_9EUKA|nr:Hypothetical protein HINF_LOCUS27993 [Hexamita inflata]CAI9940349.1 Hypothetical protein HINF_LOCUS27994 [Hexamita inflata]
MSANCVSQSKPCHVEYVVTTNVELQSIGSQNYGVQRCELCYRPSSKQSGGLVFRLKIYYRQFSAFRLPPILGVVQLGRRFHYLRLHGQNENSFPNIFQFLGKKLFPAVGLQSFARTLSECKRMNCILQCALDYTVIQQRPPRSGTQGPAIFQNWSRSIQKRHIQIYISILKKTSGRGSGVTVLNFPDRFYNPHYRPFYQILVLKSQTCSGFKFSVNASMVFNPELFIYWDTCVFIYF